MQRKDFPRLLSAVTEANGRNLEPVTPQPCAPRIALLGVCTAVLLLCGLLMVQLASGSSDKPLRISRIERCSRDYFEQEGPGRRGARFLRLVSEVDRSPWNAEPPPSEQRLIQLFGTPDVVQDLGPSGKWLLYVYDHAGVRDGALFLILTPGRPVVFGYGASKDAFRFFEAGY